MDALQYDLSLRLLSTRIVQPLKVETIQNQQLVVLLQRYWEVKIFLRPSQVCACILTLFSISFLLLASILAFSLSFSMNCSLAFKCSSLTVYRLGRTAGGWSSIEVLASSLVMSDCNEKCCLIINEYNIYTVYRKWFHTSLYRPNVNLPDRRSMEITCMQEKGKYWAQLEYPEEWVAD